jgi:hypothetical protein
VVVVEELDQHLVMGLNQEVLEAEVLVISMLMQLEQQIKDHKEEMVAQQEIQEVVEVERLQAEHLQVDQVLQEMVEQVKL